MKRPLQVQFSNTSFFFFSLRRLWAVFTFHKHEIYHFDGQRMLKKKKEFLGFQSNCDWKLTFKFRTISFQYPNLLSHLSAFWEVGRDRWALTCFQHFSSGFVKIHKIKTAVPNSPMTWTAAWISKDWLIFLAKFAHLYQEEC